MRKKSALFAVLLYLAGRAGASVLPAEKMLPDDTLVMFTVPDFNKIREVYQNSPHGRLWNDPAMKDFKDKFLTRLTDSYVTPLERDLGIHFVDYTNLPQGQFTLAVVQNGWQAKEGQSPALLLLLDAQGKGEQLKTNLTDLKKKWVDAGKTMRTEKIREVEFSVIVLPHEDASKSLKKLAPTEPGTAEPPENTDLKNEPKKEIYVGQAESLLIIGNSPKVIEKILARMSGGEVKTLSEEALYQTSASLFRDAPALGWVNAKSLVEILGHPGDKAPDDDTSNPFAFKPDKIIAALGLNGLRTVAFNYLYSNEGAQFNVAIAVPEANRTGLFQILAGEAKDCSAPAFVPADAVKFQRWRLDGQKTWATLRKMVKDFSPASLGALDFMLNSAEAAAKEKDPNFNLEKNLFGNLGDDIITYQKSPKGNTPAELNSAPSLVLLGSPNGEQLANALKTVLVIYSQSMGTPAEREFLGHKVYSIPLPSPPGPDGSATTNRNLNYAFSGGYLAISTDTTILEEYLRSSESQAKSLRDTPGLSDAAQKVGGSGTSLFGYANENESMREMFDALKKDPGSAQLLGGFAPLAVMMGLGDLKTSDWFDISLLPSFDKVSKYFYFSVYGGSATADGLNFKTFAPVPPQMKN